MYISKPLPRIEKIHKRLDVIFPEGLSDRQYLVRDMTARTIFVFLYIDAVEEQDVYLAPIHIYRMSTEQALLEDEESRESYRVECMKRHYQAIGERWYADNTREPIRDEGLRDGLVAKGAIYVNQSIPTTSSKGRYALRKHFAELFVISDDEFDEAAIEWQSHYLSSGELARVRIMQDRQSSEGYVNVILPNGESRNMEAGPSSVISKAVIEIFSKKYLLSPAVLWISQSGKKVVLEDDRLMKRLGFSIDQKTLLPDLILADLGSEKVLIVFAEVVASDGPVTESRKKELLGLAEEAGYARNQIAFVSVFEDRGSGPLKKRLSGIATNSCIWCMAEPDLLIWLGEDEEYPFNHQINS